MKTSIEIQGIWNVKAKMIPIIIGVTGTVSKSQTYMNNIPGKHEIRNYKKTAILGTAHILLKVLL